MVNEIFIAAILILPGFLAINIIRKISIYEGKIPAQEYYFWSLFLSIIIFIIFSFLTGIDSIQEFENLILNYETILLLFFISIILGGIVGYLVKKIVHGEFNVLPEQVWSITLKRLNKNEGKFVTIFTSANSEFSGRIRIYSAREDSPKEILIEDPIQIIRNEKMEVISEIEWGKEILFTEGDINRIILYESTRKDDCNEK